MNEIRISENTIIKTMSINELLAAQDVGTIATPDIQRPAGVWNAEQMELLTDTILKGWSIGAISLVNVSKDDKELLLVVDGLQRLTAMRHERERLESMACAIETALEQAKVADPKDDEMIAGYAEALEKAEADADKFSDSPVFVTVTSTEDLTNAATLFVRLNNGTPLSKIQRGTAGIDSVVLNWARGWADLLPEKVGGKISRDEAALVFAACVSNKGKMATNGPSAIKALAKLTAEQVERLPKVEDYRKAADEYIFAMTKQGDSHMLTAQYMIPYIIGSADAEHTLTAVDWAKYLADKTRIKAERVRHSTPNKGKANANYTTRRVDAKDDDRLTFGAIDEDKSNAPKATVARYTAIKLGDLYKRINGELCPGDRGYKTAERNAVKTEQEKAEKVAETVAALEAAMA